MWVKPWKLAEGFLIGGGLFAVGLALQLSMGPVRWSLFATPVNWMMLALLLGALVLMFLLRKRVYAFEWMMHGQAAVASLAWALGITLVMGLLPQTRQGGVPWLSQMLSFWPFVLIWTWLKVASPEMTIIQVQIRTKGQKVSICESQGTPPCLVWGRSPITSVMPSAHARDATAACPCIIHSKA